MRVDDRRTAGTKDFRRAVGGSDEEHAEEEEEVEAESDRRPIRRTSRFAMGPSCLKPVGPDFDDASDRTSCSGCDKEVAKGRQTSDLSALHSSQEEGA